MDLQNARQHLLTGDYTCVLCKGDTLHTSISQGVAPLLALIDSDTDVSGFSAADKVVGKATALLYRYLGVKAVYARVISRSAADILKDIHLEFDRQVSFIRNREGTGRCPMELATENISSPEIALAAIRRTLESLQKERKP